MTISEAVLPRSGLICVARKNPTGDGFIHRFFSAATDAAVHAQAMDREGHAIYYAQASFKAAENRKATNVSRVRSFWFDIDCGPEAFAKNPDHAYPTQRDGLQALGEFMRDTGLPRPGIVNSGNGLYAHWPLTDDILPDQWKEVANILKRVAAAYGFKADPARTADIASILRPVGSTNRKHGALKPVVEICGCESVAFTAFADILRKAAKAKKIEVTALLPPVRSDINSEFMAGLEGPPAHAAKVAEHCAQIARIRDTKGDVSEPLWYASIGLLRYTVEKDAIIHEWSSGYPGYSPGETDRKIAQHNFPPTTCEHFGQINAAGCIGCRWNGKIRTPLTLGRQIASVDVKTVDEERCDMPQGYVLTPDGIFYEEDNLRVYPYDLYPNLIAHDESLGYEVIQLRYNQPHEGWTEFPIRSSLTNDPKSFLLALGDNGVKIPGGTEKKHMVAYLESYVEKLRNRQKKSRLYSQMGWKMDNGELVFVLGSNLYRPDGTVESIGLARNVPDVVNHFGIVGDHDKAVAATEFFGWPGAQGHAFAYLVGAFGAPLMRFTGYEGALVSLVGESGVGKTLSLRVVNSAYGNPSKLLMLRDDTKNSVVSRLGVLGSLPLTVDEISNTDPMEISDFIYRVTQGRDKVRLTRTSIERPGINSWNTLAVATTNHSIVDKLGSLKADASAEFNRIFEYQMYPIPALTREYATMIYRTTSENYGSIGARYIQYLVMNSATLRADLDKIAAEIDRRTGARPEERFWSAIISCAILGGIIAHRLGLIRFEIAPIIDWAVGAVNAMRGEKTDQIVDSVSMLAMFIDRHMGSIVATNMGKAKEIVVTAVRDTRGSLIGRYESDTQRLFISRDALRRDLIKQHGSYSKMRKDLEALRPVPALVRSDLRKVLGAGIVGYGGAAQYVWEIDLTAPQLGNLAAVIVASNPVLNAEFELKKAKLNLLRGGKEDG